MTWNESSPDARRSTARACGRGRMRALATVPLCLIVLGVAACSATTTTTGSASPEATNGSATGSTAKPTPGRWAKILRSIPDTDEARRNVTEAKSFMSDFEVAAAELGIEVPGAGASEAEAKAYTLALRDKAGLNLVQGAAPAIGTVTQSFAPGSGQWLLAIENGRFDTASVRERATAGMDPAPRVDEYEGESFLLSQMCVAGCVRGKDKDKASRPDSAFFIAPDTYLVTANPDLMKSALDARAGRKPSLADDAGISAMTAALDEEGTFAVALQVDRPGGSTGTTAKAPAGKALALDPYVMSGVGLTASDATHLEVVVVLVAATDEAAAANVAKLRTYFTEGTDQKSGKPLADVVEVGSVRSEGRITVARLALKDSDPNWLRDALESGTLPPPVSP